MGRGGESVTLAFGALTAGRPLEPQQKVGGVGTARARFRNKPADHARVCAARAGQATAEISLPAAAPIQFGARPAARERHGAGRSRAEGNASRSTRSGQWWNLRPDAISPVMSEQPTQDEASAELRRTAEQLIEESRRLREQAERLRQQAETIRRAVAERERGRMPPE